MTGKMLFVMVLRADLFPADGPDSRPRAEMP
jgi:hypothetical protein